MLTHLNLAEGRHNVFQLKCFSLAGKCPKVVHFCKQNTETVLFYAKKKRKDAKNGERKSFWARTKVFLWKSARKWRKMFGAGKCLICVREKEQKWKDMDKSGTWPGPTKTTIFSFLELFLGSLPISHFWGGARDFFWRTCVETWILLMVFLLVMGVDENSGNSSPQLQNMKRKYSMKSLWLIWHLFCGNLGRKIRKLCVHFVRPLFFTLWSVFDVMVTKTPPKEWWIVHKTFKKRIYSLL